MTEIIFVGGFASSKYQVDSVADSMSTHFNRSVKGITFVDGSRDLEMTAAEIDKSILYTHSAGMLIAQKALRILGCQPTSIVSIAPPVTTSPLALIHRSRRIASNHLKDTARHPESAISNILHGGYMLAEIAKHSKYHAGAIPEISRFNAVDASIENKKRNIPTKLVMMNNDEFFEIDSSDMLNVDLEDIDISFIRGEHADFVCRPEYVLRRLAQVSVLHDQLRSTSDVADTIEVLPPRQVNVRPLAV